MKVFLRRMGAFLMLARLELLRRNDLVTLAVLALVLLVPLALAKPFGAAGATRYFDEAALLLIWAYSLFLSLGVGGRLFANEFASRTIYPLLAKPVSRGEALLGKYVSAVATVTTALAVFYALFLLATLVRGGEGLSLCLLQALALHAAGVALMVAFAVLVSFVATPSMAATLGAILFPAMFFFGRRLPEYAQAAAGPTGGLVWLFYAFAPHIEFFDMRQRVVHDWGGVDGSVFLAALAYAGLYTTGLLLATGWLFRRKRL